MNTSTLLRQAMHEMEAAYEEAVMEYGQGSKQAELIADGVMLLRDWLRHYTASIRTDVDTR